MSYLGNMTIKHGCQARSMSCTVVQFSVDWVNKTLKIFLNMT